MAKTRKLKKSKFGRIDVQYENLNLENWHSDKNETKTMQTIRKGTYLEIRENQARGYNEI
jgi:hypothetical protein